MWIPTPIYERIPQFWLLLGLLFMSCGTLLGFSFTLTYIYFGLGFACCLWSMSLFTMRLASRVPREEEGQPAESAEELIPAEQ